MYVIRPLRHSDLNALEGFAHSTALGMTSLPKSSDLLKEKIALSLSSFEKEVKTPDDEIYCFALEHLETGEVGGCSAVYAKAGAKEPVCAYRLETWHPHSKQLPVPKSLSVLRPFKYTNGPAELSMLFLKQEWRKERLGKLLSLSRFLFIADHRQRVGSSICARLRGKIDTKRNTSLFWEGVGRHFIPLNFSQVCALLQQQYPYIEEFFPEHPIYTHLLSKCVQETIGSVHPTTRPALRMLKKEGLTASPDIDLFDGGLILQGYVSHLRTVAKSRCARVHALGEVPQNSSLYLVSNRSLEFRSCFSPLSIEKGKGVRLPAETAQALQVTPGQEIRFILIKKFK